jgi:Holliday junction resolvase-like predicted endonuclease
MALKQRQRKPNKHDRYVLELKDKLKHKYDFISINVKIATKKRSLGEIDIIARKGKKIDLYEVKCSHRIMKAKKQLKRMKRLLNLKKSRSYFYCGSSGSLVSV